MNRNSFVRLFGMALLALLLAPPSAAQQVSRPSAPNKTLTGVVKSSNGKPKGGVHVLLQKSDRGLTRSYITDNTGQYRFKHLISTLDYRVWARYKGHDSSKSRVSRFDANPKPTVDLTVNTP